MSHKHTINDCKKIAEARQGKCLSDVYVNKNTHLTWECKNGHIWNSTFDSINNSGSWCKQCNANRLGDSVRLSNGIKLAKIAAEEHGGKCLSEEYVGTHSKLHWECKDGHAWESTLHHVKDAKAWCPTCSREITKEKLKINDAIGVAKQLAATHGGECLSTEYTNSRSKLLWRCSKGHEWKSAFGSVKGLGRWCKKCGIENSANNRRTKIEEVIERCREVNCILVSCPVFKNRQEKLTAQCPICLTVSEVKLNNLFNTGFICRQCKKTNRRIAQSLRRHFRRIITYGYADKHNSTLSFVGCSIDELRMYLQQKFSINMITGEKMSWDNYGYRGWHIDHVRPLSSFNLSDETQVLSACHYTNLQPLWAEENMKKGAHYESAI